MQLTKHINKMKLKKKEKAKKHIHVFTQHVILSKRILRVCYNVSAKSPNYILYIRKLFKVIYPDLYFQKELNYNIVEYCSFCSFSF